MKRRRWNSINKLGETDHETLKRLAPYTTGPKIAKVINRSCYAVSTYATRAGISLNYNYRITHDKTHRLWSKQDIYKLMHYATKYTVTEAARRLNRTKWAVTRKASYLGIKWYQGARNLVTIAREVGCHDSAVKRMCESLLWSEDVRKVNTGRQTRWLLTDEQADRVTAVLMRRFRGGRS